MEKLSSYTTDHMLVEFPTFITKCKLLPETGWTLVDTSLNLNLRIIFSYKLRVLIFTNSNLDQAQLKAQEEERQKREAEEKEAQLEKKREEKRLKKMVSTVCLVNCLSLEAYCVQ